uniref:PDZ domain-containing protein n=1 Tax=Timema douglasi TaxID=61478 RepID=A0A7R8VKR7_TIMDO|nr:unnamed protein product [Timema douglasi]
MSRDIDEVETVSKMSFEAEVDSKKVVTHSHDAIVDKEIGDYLQRRSRRRLASTSSSDSRISMSRDIDEVESLSKISSPVSLTKPKITRKLNFPYQQTNLNVAEVKHLDFNQIDLCNTPESISNNSSTTSKINAPSILDDDEEKHLCHETEANTYKSIQLVSTYDSDQVNTTMPAQKQNVVFKVLQTPASQSVVGETPSSICEDISYKSSKSVETLGSDQVTSKLKQNLVRVEKHRVVISDDKMPVTIKSSPHCTSSLDYNSRDTASTSNKRFRLKRNFSSNLSKSNTVQTSSDLYPVEQEKLDFQKTTEKIIPSVQLVRSQNTLEKIPSKEIPDYSSLSTEDALLQTSKNKVTVNSFVNKVTTKTSSEEAKHTKKLIAEMTSKKSSKNNLPSTKPLLTEEFCEALSSQNNSSRMNVKRKKYGTPVSTYKANSKDTSTGSLVELVSHSENFPTQLKSNTEVTKTPKQILKDESTMWAQEIIPVNLGSKEKEFNSLKNIGRLTKKVLTPNIPSKKLISNSFNSKPHLPETCLQKSTSITQTTASETKSSTFHKKIITSNISTSNSTDPNEPSSSLVGRNKKKSLENSANNSSKQVDVFSPQLERSSKTSLSNPTKPLKPFSSSFERPSKASPSNPIILNEPPCSPAPERLQKTLSHSSTKPVGHFSLPFETPPKISPSNPPKMVEPYPPKASLSNLTKPFEQFSPPPKRPPITSSNFSKPTKLVSSKLVQHHSLPRLPSDTTTKLATRPTTFNFKPSKPALNNCIRSSKPSWPDNNTIFKHPGNPSDLKKVSHSSLGQSPSTHTSMSNPLVSGNLRNDPTSEDNESDEDLDAISLFAETDIGFEQRPAEVHPKNMHPDNPLARSDSDSDISDNSDNESRPLMLPVPEFINYLNKEKENHQTVTNIPLNDEVDSNEDFPRWRSDIYQECDQSSGNENDGSECSVEVPFRVELDSHNPPSVTAEDRLDTYDDAHGMPEEGELETENENKCFAEEEDNLEDMRYNGTANIDSPNLPDKAAEQHCETNIAHYDDMSGYLMQHGNREDVNLMGYQSPSQHSSSSCRKPQEGRFCFTFLKYGNCKKYPHNCTYNHWVPHLSLYAPIEAGNYLSFTYSKGFNYASNSVLKSLIKEIIDQNETNMDRNDQELWDILVKILKGCDLRNKLQINRSSSASSQERSPHDKPTTAHAELSTQHNNRNTNMRRLTRQGKQPSPLDSIPDQTDHILHSQNITRVPKLNSSNPHNVHLSKANILSNATFQERSSDVLDYADTMSSYVRNNEEGFNKPLSYTDDINRTLYNISSAKHPIGNTAIDPKLFCPPGIRAGFNIGVPGVNKYWEDEGYSTNASRLPLPDSSREIFQNIPPLSNFSTQRPFEFQGKYGPNFHCPQRPQLPPPQGPNLPNRVRRRKKQSQTQWNLMQGPPKRNCSPMNEDECRMVFEQEWNFTLKNLKDGDFRSVSARLNSWKSRAERNEFCLRVYQELIRNGESAAPNFRRLVESAVSDSVISLRNDYDLMAMMSSIGMCLLLDLCSKSTWETAYQIHFVMKKYGIDPLISQVLKMSLYPSLEDMKVDQMARVQSQLVSQYASSYQHGASAPLPYPTTPTSVYSTSAPLPYPTNPTSAPPPYTTNPPFGDNSMSTLYPALNDYMGLELSREAIEQNMPEYAVAVPQSRHVALPASSTGPLAGMIAPLSGHSLGLQRAQVSHGLREVTICKDSAGRVGLRVQAINKGVFVCLVIKDSPAALAGLRPFERTVTLHKDSVGHIGFQYKNGKIIGLVKDSSAARNGLLTEHHLLEVNGQNVVGLKDKQITALIEEGGPIITITIIPSFVYDHMVKNRPLYLSSALAQAAPITLSTVWSAPQPLFSKPSVTIPTVLSTKENSSLSWLVMGYTHCSGKAHQQRTLKRTSATKQYSTRRPIFYYPDHNTQTPLQHFQESLPLSSLIPLLIFPYHQPPDPHLLQFLL